VRFKSFILAVLITLPASGQLPRVTLPQVPLPAVVPEAARALGSTLRDLSNARALRIDALFREHRAELDRDPAGALVIRAEVIAIDITDAALKRALEEEFNVKRVVELADLGMKVTVLQSPEGWSAARGLKRLRKLDPEGSYDFNHVYLDSGEADASTQVNTVERKPGGAGRVGLIDGGVDTPETFAGIRVEHFGCAGARVPSTHGTAVAFLLGSRGGVGAIYSADVYCGASAGGAIDAVAAAFGWMARERVGVINVSLVGPRNALLERVVKTLVAHGHLIVAAVGNDGPAAPPLFPAAYDGVVGVTAVDRNHRVLLESCRGKQVDFAAQGTDFVSASNAPRGFAELRGTSFAAPIVAAMLSVDLSSPDPVQAAHVLEKWSGLATDLGKRGRDDVYGAGELGDRPPSLKTAY
jgi:Subtilase family